jgi:cytidylate kinase
MNTKSSSEQIAEAMERVRRDWQARLKTATLAGVPVSRTLAAFTVAISREAGANGGAIAACLGEHLGWPVYDRKLLEQIGEEMGLHSSLLASVDEKRVGWVRECIAAFASKPAVSSSAYVRHLVEMVLSMGAHGDCILVGRGAAQILPPATTLRVRLVAPLVDRIGVIQDRFGLVDTEAQRWIDKTDRERTCFVRDHFHKDPADPHGYDLVLNTARLSIEESAEIIEETLHRFQARAQAAGREVAEMGKPASSLEPTTNGGATAH